MTLRLGLVTPGGFDRGDRVITALLNLAGELASRHDVHVFAAEGPSGPGRYQRNGAMVYQLAKSPDPTEAAGRLRRTAQRVGSISRLLPAIGRIHAERRFDLLHTFWALDAALAATCFGRTKGLPVVVSVAGGEAVWIADIRYGGAGSMAGRLRTRAALELADAVTVGSEFAAGRLPRTARARAQIIPLGVRCEAFSGAISRPPGPPWRLLQVADLNRVKDQETLLLAFQKVAARLGDVTLDCVGEDALLGGHLRRRAEEIGVADRVRFHGFLPQRLLPDFYRRAHLHLVSSRYESQCVAIVEAAAAGLPTVGTAVGLMPTLAPAAARCVPGGDPSALADATSELLVDPGVRHSMGEAARRWAFAHDANWTARQFEEIYGSFRNDSPSP